jgi:hypothetical protein
VRITVTEVSGDSPPIVAFETAFGSGAGCWTAEPPTRGQSYHVEIDIEDVLEWGHQVRLGSDGVLLSTEAGVVRIRARLDSVDGDVVTLSVGGSLMTIEVTGVPDGLQAEAVVEVVVEQRAIRLFPYEL